MKTFRHKVTTPPPPPLFLSLPLSNSLSLSFFSLTFLLYLSHPLLSLILYFLYHAPYMSFFLYPSSSPLPPPLLPNSLLFSLHQHSPLCSTFYNTHSISKQESFHTHQNHSHSQHTHTHTHTHTRARAHTYRDTC